MKDKKNRKIVLILLTQSVILTLLIGAVTRVSIDESAYGFSRPAARGQQSSLELAPTPSHKSMSLPSYSTAYYSSPDDKQQSQSRLSFIALNNSEQQSSSTNLTEVLKFDAKKNQLPEGLAVYGSDLYASFAPLGKVVKITLASANETNKIANNNIPGNVVKFAPYGYWPDIPSGKGFMLGLAFDVQGNLYAAVASQFPHVPSGVYRVPLGGMTPATLVGTHKDMKFPNALVFDNKSQAQKQDLYVSDSGGAIFKIHGNGAVEKWAADPLLQGNRTFCTNVPPLGMDFGANGIALDSNSKVMYVANTDKASIIKIPINKDGSAGKPEVFLGPDCSKLAGIDGLMLHTDGSSRSLYAAVNKLRSIVKISLDNRKITVLASGGLLDFPASVVVPPNAEKAIGTETPGGNRIPSNATALYITNFAFGSVQQNSTNANPGILKVSISGQ